jgi:hypothetical protein
LLEYTGLQDAYDHLNRALFDGQLPNAMIVLQRHANMKGHFVAEQFVYRTDGKAECEIALNPDQFTGCTDEQIVSTLLHEMIHLWHFVVTGKATRYHDRKWAAKMKELGLQPSSTGAPGGKETGQRMSHYILPGGAYARAFAELKATGWRLNLESAPRPGGQGKKDKSKTTFVCPKCGQQCWGKPKLAVMCAPCLSEVLAAALVHHPEARAAVEAIVRAAARTQMQPVGQPDNGSYEQQQAAA